MNHNGPQQLPLGIGLRDDATFDNFLVEANGLVTQAVEAVAKGSGEQYLFIWGVPGSGCSHLLQAACHVADASRRRAIYLPLDELAAHGPSLLEGLDSLDLVCIDHPEAVAGKRDWEEALFHLFNRLRDSGRSLLIAAGQSPRQLGIRLPDLASRLSWGMVVRLQALSDESKVKALQMRARARGIELGDEVAQYILHRSPRDMNRLFEVLDRLDQASLSAKRKVTIPFVKQAMGW